MNRRHSHWHGQLCMLPPSHSCRGQDFSVPHMHVGAGQLTAAAAAECSLQPVQAVIANAVLALQHGLCSHTAPRGTGCDRDGALTQLRKNPFATFLP